MGESVVDPVGGVESVEGCAEGFLAGCEGGESAEGLGGVSWMGDEEKI